jgi:hypothetical protein
MKMKTALLRLKRKEKIAFYLDRCGIRFTSYYKKEKDQYLDSLRHRTFNGLTLIFDKNDDLASIYDFDHDLDIVDAKTISQILTDEFGDKSKSIS